VIADRVDYAVKHLCGLVMGPRWERAEMALRIYRIWDNLMVYTALAVLVVPFVAGLWFFISQGWWAILIGWVVATAVSIDWARTVL